MGHSFITLPPIWAVMGINHYESALPREVDSGGGGGAEPGGSDGHGRRALKEASRSAAAAATVAAGAANCFRAFPASLKPVATAPAASAAWCGAGADVCVPSVAHRTGQIQIDMGSRLRVVHTEPSDAGGRPSLRELPKSKGPGLTSERGRSVQQDCEARRLGAPGQRSERCGGCGRPVAISAQVTANGSNPRRPQLHPGVGPRRSSRPSFRAPPSDAQASAIRRRPATAGAAREGAAGPRDSGGAVAPLGGRLGGVAPELHCWCRQGQRPRTTAAGPSWWRRGCAPMRLPRRRTACRTSSAGISATGGCVSTRP